MLCCVRLEKEQRSKLIRSLFEHRFYVRLFRLSDSSLADPRSPLVVLMPPWTPVSDAAHEPAPDSASRSEQKRLPASDENSQPVSTSSQAAAERSFQFKSPLPPARRSTSRRAEELERALEFNPVHPSAASRYYSLQAFAGPMDRECAWRMYQRWRQPPPRRLGACGNNTNASQNRSQLYMSLQQSLSLNRTANFSFNRTANLPLQLSTASTCNGSGELELELAAGAGAGAGVGDRSAPAPCALLATSAAASSVAVAEQIAELKRTDPDKGYEAVGRYSTLLEIFDYMRCD